MRSTRTSFAIFIAATLLVSCQGHDGEEQSHDAESHDAESHDAHAASDEAVEPLDRLELNDGQKWKMDDHTRTMFAEMATSFAATDLASLDFDALKTAGATLRDQTNQLIQGCTMSGPSHDQLHIYLSGFVPAVGKLTKSGEIADAEKVGRYLTTYPTYFE